MARDPARDPEPFFVGRQPKRHASLRARAPGVFMCSRRCGLRGDETKAGDRRRWRHGRGRHRRARRPAAAGRPAPAASSPSAARPAAAGPVPACHRRPARRPTDSTAASSATAAPAASSTAAPPAPPATDVRDEPVRRRARPCTPLTCGTYCGEIGDGCGRKLTCNACPARTRVPRRPLRRSGLRPDHLRRRRTTCATAAPSATAAAARSTATPARTAAPAAAPATTRTSATTRPARRSRARRWAASTAAPSATAAAARRTAARARTAWRARRPAPARTSAPARRRPRRRPAPARPRRRSAARSTTRRASTRSTTSSSTSRAAPLPTLAEGVSCDRCGAEVDAPFASALTDITRPLLDDAGAGALHDERAARHAGRQVAPADHDPVAADLHGQPARPTRTRRGCRAPAPRATSRASR